MNKLSSAPVATEVVLLFLHHYRKGQGRIYLLLMVVVVAFIMGAFLFLALSFHFYRNY